MADPSPASAGFRMPPEWSRQEATWLSWPWHAHPWADRKEQSLRAHADFVAAITRFQPARILCVAREQPEALRLLRESGAAMERVACYDIPTNGAWCRDHGPTFLVHGQTGEVAMADFVFNAWGGKYPPWDDDAAVPRRIAEALGMRRFAIPLTAEGGGIEVNGEGLVMTTESVLLNPNRNPGVSRGRVEELLRSALGVEEVLWLPGGMLGDDTDGHIDTLARFIRPDAVVAPREPDPAARNHAVLEENFRRLTQYRSRDGGRLEVIALPNPGPMNSGQNDERILPPSYANFLLVNGAVLVPSYRQPEKDGKALEILAHCFPDREAVAVDCETIIREGGALHCLSQQQPKR